MALKKRKSDAGKIEPGMKVEATQGDLGEADISKPKVTGVARDEQGNAGKLVVEKGVIFKSYIVTAIFSGANWGAVLINTFVPHISFSFASISSAVALLGATFSPYSMFWQVQGEKEQKRPGSTKMQLRSARLDIASGVISGNLVAYFIIICTSATIFIHHGQINTAADAARALQPLLGPFASYLFAIGLIGSGLIAIPILLASTSYAVAGTFGWPGALSKKPWQNEGFYLILTIALVASLAARAAAFQLHSAYLLGQCAGGCAGARVSGLDPAGRQ